VTDRPDRPAGDSDAEPSTGPDTSAPDDDREHAAPDTSAATPERAAPATRAARPDPFAPLPLEPSLDVAPARPAPQAPGEPRPAPDVTPATGASEHEPAPAAPTDADAELRAAIGATPRPRSTRWRHARTATGLHDDAAADAGDDDDGPGLPRNRKAIAAAALVLVVGTGVAATAILGNINRGRYALTCEADRMLVERGRAFPPWGTAQLEGAAWRPLKLPPEAPCTPRETTRVAELAGWYLQALTDRATSLLTAREVTQVDEAHAQLEQALLVTRALASDEARADARAELERLLGDVAYWRASAKLRAATDAMLEASRQFEEAATRRPRHVTDAAAWASFVRQVVADVRRGPAGASPSTRASPGDEPVVERPTAPPGVELPVEPSTEPVADAPAEAAPIDAGVPTGGVLL